MRRYLVSTAAALVVLWGGAAFGAVDTQVFDVTVASNITITAPTTATIAHDTTDANQAFTAQSWTLTCNATGGGAVTFAVAAPFVHTTISTYKADCKLALALGTVDSEASWAVTLATDQTDYSNATPDNAAQVTAASTAAGDAALNLTVTFVQADYSVLAAGTYETTVTGTVTAN